VIASHLDDVVLVEGRAVTSGERHLHAPGVLNADGKQIDEFALAARLDDRSFGAVFEADPKAPIDPTVREQLVGPDVLGMGHQRTVGLAKLRPCSASSTSRSVNVRPDVET
jgi:hypothetical protein